MFTLFIVLVTIVGFASSQSSTAMPSSSTSRTGVNTWSDLGVLAIRAVTELSRVSIVASRQDYRLDTSRSYNYIKYPSSYRATLTQATDVVERALRGAEMSMSRVQMIMGQTPKELNTALQVLSQGSIQEIQIFLPDTLKNIGRMGKDSSEIVGKISAEFEQVVAFFDELLRAVQPSTPSSPSGSTSTQVMKSPLDIDHATAISNLLTHFKSLVAIWNQVSQHLNKIDLQTSTAIKVMNNKNTLIWGLREIDETADLVSALASFYNVVSTRAITQRIPSIGTYMLLQSEEERLAEIQKVNERTDRNIPQVGQAFAQEMANHEAYIKERNEQYDSLIATPST